MQHPVRQSSREEIVSTARDAVEFFLKIEESIWILSRRLHRMPWM